MTATPDTAFQPPGQTMPRPAHYAPVSKIDPHLAHYVRTLALPSRLRDAIEYALLGGGKRIRPLLAWHASIACGGRGEDALPAATAVELIHAFSLVHDDLPALDNDDLRRGRPTLHRHAGEPMAILAGDAMMAMAFRCLVDLPRGDTLSALLTRELATGTMAMIEGQVYDTLGGLDESTPPREQVRTIHANKTGALILAAVRMGALCALDGDTSTPESRLALTAVTRYGTAVGLMFQVADDLLDVEQSAEHTGKRTGKDQDAGKLTYPGVLGVEGTRAELARLRDEALEAIAVLGPSADGLGALCRDMAERTK